MNRQALLPFMSVVIPAFNAEKTVARAIESVLAQDYPKDRLEIIVIDDGSTDATYAVISRYPVRVAQHATNLGISSARRTGLAHVSGEVYVCFDADCVAPTNWLRALAGGYAKTDALGVGSLFAAPTVVRGWVDRFMAASGAGNPVPLGLDARMSPFRRFVAYLKQQLAPAVHDAPEAVYAVRQINGASASFPVDVLRSVGGWDQTLRWMEDAELCRRLAAAHPERQFYAVSASRLIHDPKMDLRTFLRRPFVRGYDNLCYYRRGGMVPPIFPLPLAWILVTLAALAWSPVAGLATGIVLPQLLYVWWPMRALRGDWWNLTYAYLQLAEELSGVAGLARGYAIIWMRGRHVEEA